MAHFSGSCHGLLIGSLPLADHLEAFRWIVSATPELPLWGQLPSFVEEGMIVQFAPGLPGLVREADRLFVDTAADAFEHDLLAFYEDYMAVSDGVRPLEASRFALDRSVAMGFHVLLEQLPSAGLAPVAVKGQVTGPVTFGLGLHDREGRSLFYDMHTRDVVVKLLAMKARWQIRRLKSFGTPVVVFVDEPALAGYGSSELISVSRQEIIDVLAEVIDAIHGEGAIAGVHVCANTEWSMILETGTDIVNFDAFAYFDRFILYPEAVRFFLNRGGMIAWGIVPTGDDRLIDNASVGSLYGLLNERIEATAAIGYPRQRLLDQSLITPSCGTGSLSIPRARKVLDLTRDLSRRAREAWGLVKGRLPQ